MLKTASYHHHQGHQLLNALVDEHTKEAFLLEGGIGAYGRHVGARDARRILRDEGVSERDIAMAEDDARGYGRSAASGIGYGLLGSIIGGGVAGLPGAVAGDLIGAGWGAVRSRRKTKRDMLDAVDRYNGRRARKGRHRSRRTHYDRRDHPNYYDY